MSATPRLDPDLAQPVQACFAIAQVKRGKRKRFAENCVEVVADEATALAQAQPEMGRHAVEVIGPSRSSEGLRLYYLVRWLGA
ncbi:MAG: hypothetical protein KAX57_10525 [Rhodoferax sp.]|jgi:hypothetical protein|uniref:hypothetical protein n=1 Tax=Rhodoferax sp. TaxID=50421 RepID=UPI001B4E7A6F|nr:hypothetical protein [Rhodoferax sp.]MBP8287253.1 hypothetical protein [Rhodoferax sp.]MBP9148112.1 hypothetical protein [Rhodoferax sp.]MBP9735909.1 hypothetical protein [Rhodoferax sp.]